jgi:hypothetical protein
MHQRGVFGVLAFTSFKAVSFHGWVADLDKSGKLIVPYWALQEMGHGMARYSSGLGFELYICARVAPSDRQVGYVHLIRKLSTTFTSLTLSSTFQSPPHLKKTKSAHRLPNQAPRKSHSHQTSHSSITVQRPSIIPNQINLIASPTSNLHPIRPKGLEQPPHTLLQLLDALVTNAHIVGAVIILVIVVV